MTDILLQILQTLADSAETVSDLLDMLVDKYPYYATQVSESLTYAQDIISHLSTDLLIHLV